MIVMLIVNRGVKIGSFSEKILRKVTLSDEDYFTPLADFLV